MKLRTGDPWMPAPVYGRALHGSPSICWRVMSPRRHFTVKYWGPRSSIAMPTLPCAVSGAEWMLHADHTYLEHPLHARWPMVSRGVLGRSCACMAVIRTLPRPRRVVLVLRSWPVPRQTPWSPGSLSPRCRWLPLGTGRATDVMLGAYEECGR